MRPRNTNGSSTQTLTRPRAEPHLRGARLLVPIDFSSESRNALRYARALVGHLGASWTLLHVVEPIVCEADFGYGPVTRRCPDLERLRKSEARLKAQAKRLADSPARPAVVVRTGVAHAQIVEAARALGADLIVMGTHGNASPAPPALGSTAERVVRQAPCPVLVVRKKEHEFVWSRKPRQL